MDYSVASMLEKVYLAMHRRRQTAYLAARKALPVPVLSVGNITLGGTGKTPFCIWLAERLAGEGLTVGIASRGYPLKHETPKLLTGKEDAAAVGDEPLFMARRLAGKAAVAVCLERYKAGELLIREKGIDVLVLDDGFQHVSLHRELDFVLLDARAPFGANKKLLPLGSLREPPEALKRADVFVLSGARQVGYSELPHLSARLAPWNTRAPVLWTAPKVSGVVSAEGEAEVSVLGGGRVWLLSGIAGPERFEASVREAGLEVAGHQRFRDHHAFSEGEVVQAVKQARQAGAVAVMCTEKDWVKLAGMAAGMPVYALRVGLDVMKEPEGFWEMVMTKARRRADG